jgi:hypothetical protein
LSAEEGTAALLNRAGELAKEEKLLGELKPEIGQVFYRDYYRNQMAQLDQENPFDWSTIDDVDSGFGSQVYDDLTSIESDMQNLDMRIDDLFINEQYYEPEVFKRLLNEAQEERQILSETYDQLASYKNAVNDFEIQQVAEEAGASAPEAFNDREYLNSQLGQDQELDQIIEAYNNYDDRIAALEKDLDYQINELGDAGSAYEIEKEIQAFAAERDSMRQSATTRLIDLNSNTRPDFVPKPAPTIIPQTPGTQGVIDLRRSLRSAQTQTPAPASSFDLSRINTTATTPAVDRAAELNDLFLSNSATSGATVSEVKPFNFSQETLNQIDDSLFRRIANSENPSQMLENINRRFRSNSLTQEAYDEFNSS